MVGDVIVVLKETPKMEQVLSLTDSEGEFLCTEPEYIEYEGQVIARLL